jgi:hypothetical protein
MLEPRRLTTLWAFMASFKDRFIFTFKYYHHWHRGITYPATSPTDWVFQQCCSLVVAITPSTVSLRLNVTLTGVPLTEFNTRIHYLIWLFQLFVCLLISSFVNFKMIIWKGMLLLVSTCTSIPVTIKLSPWLVRRKCWRKFNQVIKGINFRCDLHFVS